MAGFTQDVFVYRVGAGAGTLTSAATAVFLDEYHVTYAADGTASATLAQSIAMPTTASGNNHMLTDTGTGTSDGELNLSENGQYLVFTGYNAAVGTTGVASSATSAVARVVGLVSATGSIDTTTALTDSAITGNNIRSADSTNGADIWIGDAAGGVRYTTLGSASSVQVDTGPVNIRDVEIFNNTLYFSTSSSVSGTAQVRVEQVGSTGVLPTSSGSSTAGLPGFATAGSPYEFFMAHLAGGAAGINTLYVADDGASGSTTPGITKYSLVSGSWVSNGTIGAAGDAYRGLAGEVDANGNVILFATGLGGSGANGGGKLVTFADTSGYNGALPANTTVSTIATNTTLVGLATAANINTVTGSATAFRGVALAPDVTAPTLVSENPANGATQVAGNSDLVLTFSEAVKAGSGNIYIMDAATNTTVQTISVTDTSAVTFGGLTAENVVTVNPPADLPAGSYYVTMDAGAFTDLLGNATAAISDSATYNFAVCFYPGALVATPEGPRAVETLVAGDLVLTHDGGVAPIRWMGRQTVSTMFADPLRVLPIRIRAGALAENLPVRDLLVSPDHALFIDGVLIHAGALVNGVSITRESDVPKVFTYWHVETADHSLVLVEGVAAETFVDNVDRLAFDNWDEHNEAQAPAPIAEMPYPRAKAARQVPRSIREALNARATAIMLGFDRVA